MTTLHIYAAKAQPATRYTDMTMGDPIVFKNPPRKLIRCHACGKLKWAKNLTAHVYYDGTNFYCRYKKWYRGRKVCK